MSAQSETWAFVRLIPVAIFGFFVPLKVASRTLLLQDLKSLGVPVNEIPTHCVLELAEANLKLARLVAQNSPTIKFPNSARANLVYRTEYVAERIAELMAIKPISPRESSLNPEGRAKIAAVLQRYGVVLAGGSGS
jgi:hypothetical protein